MEGKTMDNGPCQDNIMFLLVLGLSPNCPNSQEKITWRHVLFFCIMKQLFSQYHALLGGS